MRQQLVLAICLFIVLSALAKGQAQAVPQKAGSSAVRQPSKVERIKLAGESFKKGSLFYELEEYDKAREYFAKAIKYRKDKGIYYHNLALAYFKDGYYEKAEKYFRKAGQVDPNLRSLADFYRGVIYYEAGKLAKARAVFTDIIERQGKNRLGIGAERMLEKVEAEMRPKKDWGIYLTVGAEQNDNVSTEFDTTNDQDQGNFLDIDLYYRPAWWPGAAMDYIYSNIGYQKVISANVVAQMVRVGTDLNSRPFFYYDYTYAYYWLNARPYYQANKVKLMLNYQLIPFDVYARTGFFIAGENKLYFPEIYKDYKAVVTQLGIEQTLFTDLYGSVFYTRSFAESPENYYQSLNYAFNWYWPFWSSLALVTDWKYEFRPYDDYYGFTRQDIYKELAVGLRWLFGQIYELSLERRNIRNESNVDFKAYQDAATVLSISAQF